MTRSCQSGVLVTYARDPKETFQSVARLLKKILGGAAPGDLPVEQPTKYNLVIKYSIHFAIVMEAILLRVIKRTLPWATAATATVALLLGALITWPDPLFAFSLGSGKIIVASDRPIPPVAESGFSVTAKGCWSGRRLKSRSASIGSMLPTRTGDSACSLSHTPTPGASLGITVLAVMPF
jgi:hypothetical protein